MKFHYVLLFVLTFACRSIFATHAFPLVNYNFTAGPTGITVNGSSNGATCGGGPYWMQIEVSCSPSGFLGVQPTCLINTLTNWTGPGVTYVSYPFFNSLLNVPGYSAPAWSDNCVLEPYNSILIPYSYFCPGTTMYFRAREAVYGTTSTGPWTAVNAFVVPGTAPVPCSASLTHSPFTTALTPSCPGAKTLTINNPNCPLPCASPALAPSCVTSTVYYKYYDNGGNLQGITTSPTLALPNVTATTTYSVFRVDSCGGNGVCPPKSSCGFPGGGWPQMTTIFISAPNIIVAASPATICPTTSSTLTATGGVTYTWQPGSLSGGAVVVSPPVTQIYTVTATNSLSCISSKTVQVTVSPAPVITANTSTNVVCAGSPATLTAGGATNYTWSTGATTSVIVVTPTITTSYTVVGGNGSCTGQATVNISVIGSPTVSAFSSTNTICAGGTVSLLAGGALTYTWQPGNLVGSNVVVSPAATTIFTVTGTLLSCTDTETVQISVSNGPTMTIVSSPTTICSASGGSATLSASGAVSYTWNPGAILSSSIVITPTVTSTFSVTGANALGCQTTNTLSYSVTPTPTLNTTSSSTAICAGSSATLNATGAASYTWNPGALIGGTVTVSPASNTTYTVIGANGSCISTKTIALVVNANPTVSTAANPTVICSGGSSTLTAIGALTYTWQPGSLPGGTVTVSPGSTTVYTVTGSNAAGCTHSATRQVSVNITPTLNPISTPTSICVGGTATLSTGGATTYTWNPGNLSGASVTVSPASTTVYTVTGTTANCTDTKTISLLVNPIPTVNATVSPTVICAGASATLTGSGALTYTWNPGNIVGNPITVNPLVTTLYTVTGSNGSCTSTKTVNLIVNPNPTITAVVSPTNICVGSSATLSSSGATSYTWNPGALIGGTVTVNPAATTLYTVTGANGFGCSTTNTVNLIVTPIPTINVAASPGTICAGNSTTLTATGATSYTWNPGALTGGTVTVSPATNTTYTVTGSNGGCSTTNTVAIIVNPNPTITAVVSPTNICAGSTATLSSSGATSYTWNPGAVIGGTVTVNPAATTLYTVTGANAFGCTTTNTVNLIVTPIPTVNVIASPTAICAGGSTSLIANGATNYTWMPGSLTGSNVSVSPLVNTTYTVTGSNGTCSNTKTITVIVNPIPTLTVTATPTAICNGGSATLTASGAAAYNWLPGALVGANVVVNPTVTTTYTVIGTSAAGCSSTNTITLIVNPIPTITAVASPTNICAGSSATLTSTGAASYTWNPGALIGGTVTVNPAATTLYTVTGANAFGCTTTKTVNLLVTPIPTVNATASPTAICAGGSTTLTASGATSYTWNPGALIGTTVSVSPAISTTYTVTGSNGACSNTKTISVIVNPLPTLTVTATPTAICNGGSATLTASGAAAYNWLPGALVGASVVVNPTVTTTYTVIGTSSLGCSNTKTITLIVNPIPSLTVTATPTAICSGNSTTLTGTATGGGPFASIWNPGAIVGPVAVVSPVINTVYTWSVSNSFGCVNSKTISINVTTTPTIVATASNFTICAGGTTSLAASGAATYTWNPGALIGGTVTVNPTVTTTYSVTGSNGACTDTKTVTIVVNPNPTITATSSPTNICAGSSATLSSSGAASYTWNPGAVIGGTIAVTPTATTLYTVTASNAFGCTTTNTVNLVVTPNPTVIIGIPLVPICAGSTATLVGIGATSYTWLPGGSNATVLVVPLPVAQTFTLIGSNGLCQSTGTAALIPVANPTISATASPTTVCAGSNLTLTASGANTYSWNPIAATGSVVITTPTITTTYSVVGTDINGCIGQTTVNVLVSPIPTLTASASATSICVGTTVTLTANGSGTYTWNPTGLTTATITDTPTLTTTYTVSSVNAFGCIGTSTVTVVVNTVPSLTVSPINATVCSGYATTLTALGATNYTWLPSGNTTSATVETPTVNTTYTVIGANGVCSSQFTVDVFVTPLPANLTATTSGSITCTAPTVTLTGSSTTTNVSYAWAGPFSFTSTSQSPTVNVQGTYTFSVIDNSTGCIASVTLNVPTDSSIPSVTATTSGSITCANPSVTINATTTSTNVSYSWTGPGSFTSTAQTFTSIQFGVYTVTVTDLSSTCSTTAIVSVGIHTQVAVTASITPATCSGSVTNNDGTISVSNFTVTDKYDLVVGSTYTGTATYLTATFIPTTGIITNTLANPTNTVAYTIRIFDAEGCFKDTTLILIPINCLSVNSLGLAKAVSTPTLNANGSYDITYKVVVKNYGLLPLNDVALTENLNNTFPLPTTFSVVSAPLITSIGSSLTLDPAFDGSVNISLTNPLTSTLNLGQSDTIVFGVRIFTNGFFGPFNNSVIGLASPSPSVFVTDSSEIGLDPDPDTDLDPTNNNIPTPIQFTPNIFFGITKKGVVGPKLSDKTYDVTYTITIHNLGNDTLKNVTAKDSLFNNTVRYPATYVMKTAPVATGSLNANALFNGNSDINLLTPGLNVMAPGDVNTIVFTINVNPDTVTIFKNSAYGNALSSTSVTVSDTSNTGDNPDSNNNGVWNEPADNLPTVLIIPNTDFFIPDGFSPNDDGKNDLFVIKGLPVGVDNVFTVYNRWGNKVYSKSNYDNTWNGTANVNGTLGTEKLPPGTYYYILEFKGGDIQTTNGFIVIQY